MEKILNLSFKIYNTKKIKEYRRVAVFLTRVLLSKKRFKKLMFFFDGSQVKKDIINKEPYFLEQATRKFLYKDSKIDERITIIKKHFDFMERMFTDECLRKIYIDKEMKLWESDYNNSKVFFSLDYDGGQKKEGLLAINIRIKSINVYQMIFWIGVNNSLYIGAMQGPNTSDANEIIKGLTKHCYGYRTKNLILFATRCVAKTLGIQKIYAVSNKGYYANNHIRLDRKLKTSLDDFWEEAGGKITADYRFYELPVEEYRKSIEEIKTHKRNLYRKRFELLDSIEETIKENLLEVMNK